VGNWTISYADSQHFDPPDQNARQAEQGKRISPLVKYALTGAIQ